MRPGAAGEGRAGAIAAATRARADDLEAAYRLAARRCDALEAMLARAETHGRDLARALAQAHAELRSVALRRAAGTHASADAGGRGSAQRSMPRPQLRGCLAYYLERLGASVAALEMQGLRDRTPAARELLARIASGGHMDYETLIAFAGAATHAPKLLQSASLLEPFDPEAVRSLACIVGNQQLDPRDESAAIALLRFLISGFGSVWMNHAASALFVDVLTHSGALREAQSRLRNSALADEAPADYACLLANTLHPATVSNPDAQTQGAWLAAVNALFTPHGLETVRVVDGEQALLHRLECPLPADAAIYGPLVTVLMTTCEPDATVATAIRAVLAQSWRNLELIITDDASGEQGYARLRELARMDERIVLLHNDVNQGTYVAKNRGLSVARGEFVTCHDSDDWSHPRKIERQVAQLIARSGSAGNLSFWVRSTDDIVFRRFSPHGEIRYINTSSLMFRRRPVLERCGYWDSARAGADTEYCRRIEAVFGGKLLRIGGAPLAFGQVRQGSLTANASDGMSNGWVAPRRRRYRAAWEHWHKSTAAAGGSLYVARDEERRAFPVPPRLLPRRATGEEAARSSYDAIVVSDFRGSGSGNAALAAEIGAAAANGRRIGICQLDSFRPDLIHLESISSRVQQLLHDGLAETVELDDAAQCRLLLVHDPAVLQFPAATRSRIETAKLQIVAGPRPPQDGAAPYEVDACSRNAQRIFGTEATWTAASPLARALDAAAVGGRS